MTRRFSLPQLVRLIVMGLALASLVTAEDNSGLRTWTDVTNRTVSARFLGIRGANVILQTVDGVRYPFPLAKLAEADRKIAKELQKAADDRDPAKQSGAVTGILFDVKATWITVKPDGEDEPTKYVFGDDPDKKIAQAMKAIFNASRVELSYKRVGSERQVTAIKRQIPQIKGTFHGTVVALHDRFWLEAKPINGPPDAFAPGANYNDKAFMALLNSLKPGDQVTLTYYTDSERHRILSLTKGS